MIRHWSRFARARFTLGLVLFAASCCVAHLSGIHWGAFGIGGFWALFCFCYPGYLNYD